MALLVGPPWIAGSLALGLNWIVPSWREPSPEGQGPALES